MSPSQQWLLISSKIVRPYDVHRKYGNHTYNKDNADRHDNCFDNVFHTALFAIKLYGN